MPKIRCPILLAAASVGEEYYAQLIATTTLTMGLATKRLSGEPYLNQRLLALFFG